MNTVVTWFTCGRDAGALCSSVASVAAHLEEDSVLVAVEDEKDLLPSGCCFDVEEIIQGADHGRHLDSLPSICAQVRIWLDLIERYSPDVILKIDSDVLLMSRLLPDLDVIEGQSGAAGIDFKSVYGGAYTLPAKAITERFRSGKVTIEINEWIKEKKLWKPEPLEDQVITGMVGEVCPMMRYDEFLGFHSYDSDESIMHGYQFIEFGRLRGIRANSIEEKFEIRDRKMQLTIENQ